MKFPIKSPKHRETVHTIVRLKSPIYKLSPSMGLRGLQLSWRGERWKGS